MGLRPGVFRLVLVLASLLAAGLAIGWGLAQSGAGGSVDHPDRAAASAPAGGASVSRPASAESEGGIAGDAALLAALDAALREVDPAERSAAFGRAIRAFFARDPEAALARLRGLSSGNEYTAGLLVVLGGIGERDPGRALALARELAISPADQVFYSQFFDRLARENPLLAEARIIAVPAGEGRANALRAIVARWASQAPDAALAWARGLKDVAERATALEATAVILAQSDPLRAVELARETLSGDALDRVLADGLGRLTERDPVTAARVVMDLPVGVVRDTASLGVVRALAAKDPAAALDWMRSFAPAGELSRLALNNLLDVWGKTSPAEAEAHVAAMQPGPAQDAAAAHLALTLAAADPAAALAWADALPSAAAQDAALINIVSTWARTDPAAAARWASSLEPGDAARLGAITSALSYWTLQDSRAAAAFVPTLSVVEQPQAAVTVGPALAQIDVTTALAWASSLGDADIRDIALDAVVTRWAENRPDEAARWVAAEPESPARVDRVRAVAERWLETDAEAALAWVRGLAPGPSRDGALDAAAAKFAPTEPAVAAGFANAIQAPALREARLGALAIDRISPSSPAAR